MGSDSLGSLIRQEREKRGWDQAVLAAQLDIGQQTVSRWECGKSRPQRAKLPAISTLLGIEHALLLVAAGYASAAQDSAESRQPVRPLSAVLPLAALPPDRFEGFCRDLVAALHPLANVSLYGGPGHRQHGVDVLASQGVAIDYYQCKRHKEFGPAKVRGVVEAVEVSAEHYYLVLSRRSASPGARAEVLKHSAWTLWDAEDVSRVIRMELPKDQAVRLVDTYFAGWRTQFLGVAAPSCWLTPEEFFRPFAGDHLFSHFWPLVGRTRELDAIRDFAKNVGEPRVGVVSGTGGIGKTRLLRSVAQDLEEGRVTVRFLGNSAAILPGQFDLLPTGRLVVVVDDAHQRQDLAAVLHGIIRFRPDSRILLSSRTNGLVIVRQALRTLGLYEEDFPMWTLVDLSVEEAEQLASGVLHGEFDRQVIRRLALHTADCPLITVVGAGLIARGVLEPRHLESSELIHHKILLLFSEALTGGADGGLRRELLDAVAMLQPVWLDQAAFRGALETITGVSFQRLVRELHELEDAGILLRRGASLRIVPDLLGDALLLQACLDTRSGVQTGYVERVMDGADGAAAQHVIINTSRIDWQSSQLRQSGVGLVETVWSRLDNEFRSAGIRGRIELVKLVSRVAFHQPKKALALAEWALTHRIDEVEEVDHPLARLYVPTYRDVIAEIPQLVKNVAYTFDYFAQSLDLLWELAQEDDRAPRQHPDHALRILTELAEFEPGKALAFNRSVIDAARRWLRSGTNHWSPFDVLESLLATESADSTLRAHTLTMTAYALRRDSILPIRQAVIDLAFDEAASEDPRRAVRAIRAIGTALHYPIGMYGRTVDESERAEWTPEFVATIKRLGEVTAGSDLDSSVTIAVREILHWHATYSRTGTRDGARRVIGLIPETSDHDLALALFDGWGRLMDRQERDYAESRRAKDDWFRSVVEGLGDSRSAVSIVGRLQHHLALQELAFPDQQSHPLPFISTLVGMNPEVGLEICRRVAASPDSALRGVLAVALAQLTIHRPAEAIGMARKLVAKGLAVEVSQALGWYCGAWEGDALAGLDILRQLAQHHDPRVRVSVAQAMLHLADVDRSAAVTLALSVRFDDSSEVATAVLRLFGSNGPIPWSELGQPEIGRILSQLEALPRIDDYHVTEALSELSQSEPEAVVNLLMGRIEHSENCPDEEGFTAVPFVWDNALRLAGHPRFPVFLRQWRDWLAASLHSWRRRRFGAETFWAMAGDATGQAVEALKELLNGGSRVQVETVGAILAEGPKTLIWSEIAFIAQVLRVAESHGDECLRLVGGSLDSAVTSGIRRGTPGEPFPADIEQRDRASAILETLPPESVEALFYRSLRNSARSRIQQSIEREEALKDGRDW